MTDEVLAQDFISQHLKTYGLVGTNNDALELTAPLGDFAFTKDNHFRFGFNHICYNERANPYCIYWTDYARPPGFVRSFRDELLASLIEIREQYGPLSIGFTGSAFSYLMIAACQELKMDLRVFVLSLDITNHDLLSRCPVAATPLTLPRRQFEAWLWQWSDVTKCCDPLVAYNCFLGEHSDDVHIYDDGINRFINLHYDLSQGKIFAPAHLVLVDNERATAINRYLLKMRRPGFPQILKYTPELIASYMQHPLWQSWRQQGENNLLPGDQARNDVAAQIAIYTNSFAQFPTNTNFFISPLLPHAEWCKGVKTDLLRKFPRCEDQAFHSWQKLMEWAQ